MSGKSGTKANECIRREMRIANIKTWQLADLLGVCENTVYNRLRHELPDDEQYRYIELIRNWADFEEH